MVRSRSRVRLGVSSCLLGQKVRYDGRHKLDRLVRDGLGRRLELVPVCPETELGLGVPRPPIRLVTARGQRGGVRLVGVDPPTDHTAAMRAWAERRVHELGALGLHGFVLQARSPSCGVRSTPVWSTRGPVREGAGLFVRVLREALPLVPLEEAERLHEPRALDRFFLRMDALAQLTALGPECPRRDLIGFHARYEPLLLAHGRAGARALGRLAAAGPRGRARDLFGRYAAGFARHLERPPQP